MKLLAFIKDPRLLILLTSIAIAIALIFIRLERHHHLISSTDEATFTQLAYNTFHGRFLITSLEPDYFKKAEASVLSLHSMLSLPFFLFPYLFVSHPLTLAFWQMLLVFSGVLAIYHLAQHFLKDPWIAAALCIAYIMNVNIFVNTLWVHESTIAVPIFLWAFYFHAKGRKGIAIFLFLILLFLKENFALSTAAIGILFLLDKENRKEGALLAILGVSWFLFSTLALIPWASEYVRDPFSRLAFTPNPSAFAAFLDMRGWLHMAFFLLPFLFLPLLAPRYLIPALPGIALLFLGGVPSYFGILSSRHATPLLGPFFLASIHAFQQIHSQRIRKFLVFSLCAIALFSMRYAPLHSITPAQLTLESIAASFTEEPESVRHFKEQILGKIPGEATISASHYLTLYFSERRWIHVFPMRWREADFLIVDQRRASVYPFTKDKSLEQTLEEISHEGRFASIFSEGDFLVLRRTDSSYFLQ